MYLFFHNKNNLKERKEGGRKEKTQRQCKMNLVVSVSLRRTAFTTGPGRRLLLVVLM